MAKKLKVDRVEMVTNYKKKQIETDFSGIGGLMKLVGLFAGGKPAEKPPREKRIAVVYAVGEIVEGKGAGDMFGNSALGSTTMIEALRKASDDPKVVAVVLRVDSPGGSATASDLIWRETVRCKKPLIASMGDVAGSGGYYIAMGARNIVAEPGTITGSIGVIGGKLVTGGLYEKIGLTTEVISRGKNSGALSSTQPLHARRAQGLDGPAGGDLRPVRQQGGRGAKDGSQAARRARPGPRLHRPDGQEKRPDRRAGHAPGRHRAGQEGGRPEARRGSRVADPAPAEVGLRAALRRAAAVVPTWNRSMPDVFHLVRQAKVWRQMLREKTLLWMPYQIRLR